MQNKTGKLIVIYGINNLGKTTQAKILVEEIIKQGLNAEYLKYPLYNLAPSGTIINDYLRKGNSNNLSAREFQIIQILNRTQFQPILKQKLNSGINIVAEDYVGTGIAWGVGAGVNANFLSNLNSHLINPDLCFYFEGQRFLDALEKNHKHETDNELTLKVKKAHEILAKEFGWIKINANETIDEIHQKIWRIFLQKIQTAR